MFTYFKLKRSELQLKVLLLGKLYNFVESIPDIGELAKKFKDMDVNDFQNNVATELVNFMKAKEEKYEE